LHLDPYAGLIAVGTPDEDPADLDVRRARAVGQDLGEDAAVDLEDRERVRV
jgi:hypothetical protein